MNQDKPLITIVTVCYNDAGHIERTIQSVLGQTYENKEYIIIDGGSNDGTFGIIKKYSRYIDAIISEPDNGIYDAMNKAIQYAHGEWLNFMNSGDIYHDNHVVQRVAESGLMSTASFIYSDFIVSVKGKQYYIKQDYDKGRVLHQSLFYKRSLHDKYGMYVVTHPYIVSDYLFFIQVDKKFVAKFNEPISINDGDGLSMSGSWAPIEKECVDFMFRRVGAWGLIFNLIKTIIKQKILKIIR